VLLGRAEECAVVDGVLGQARAGASGVLLVTGEPGVGKSALLEHAVESASGFQVVRAAGVEPEMELAFAGLQQLCAPLLDGLAARERRRRSRGRRSRAGRAGGLPAAAGGTRRAGRRAHDLLVGLGHGSVRRRRRCAPGAGGPGERRRR
jgi:AAA ATPase domain